jgi:hypothetical protein
MLKTGVIDEHRNEAGRDDWMLTSLTSSPSDVTNQSPMPHERSVASVSPSSSPSEVRKEQRRQAG